MEEFKNIVKGYLSSETDYALLLTGKWGSGKTYFFKNELEKDISSTEVYGNAAKKYKVVYVSLYGLQSINDISNQILTSLFPALKKPSTKLALSLVKMVARGAVATMGLRDLDKYIADGKEATQEAVIDIKQLFFCFDDFERKSDDLNLKDLIGYINNIVSTEGAKVLIIGHEDIYNEGEQISAENADVTTVSNPVDKGNTYQVIKEKTIQVTYYYDPDFELTTKSIIDEKYEIGAPEFYQFIDKHQDVILPTLTKANQNLRTVTFALARLQDFFSFIELNFIDKYDPVRKVIDEKMSKLIIFALCIAIEFRSGRINHASKFKLYRKSFTYKFSSNAGQLVGNRDRDETEVDFSYYREIGKSYFEPFQFVLTFFETIFDYICSGKPLDKEGFETEIGAHFSVEVNPTPANKVYSQVSNDFLELDDKEYKFLIGKLLEYAENGDYMLHNYPSILHLIFRFDNLLGYRAEEVVKILKVGINKTKSKLSYDHTIRLLERDLREDSTLLEYHKELIEECIKVNYEIREEENVQKAKKLVVLFENNLIRFLEEINRIDSNFKNSNLFHHYSAWKFYLRAKELSKVELHQLCIALDARYNHTGSSFEKELPFFEDVHKYLNRPKWRKKKTLQNVLLDDLSMTIKKIINELSKT